MKLPIIQSIMYGALFPSVVITRQKINGKLTDVPANFSRIDYNGDPADISMITQYEIYEPDPDDPINFPELRTQYLLNYPELYHAFSSLPSSLPELEQLCIKNLSPYVPFDFKKEEPVNISNVMADEYTPVSECYYPVDFHFVDYIPQYPFAKFYVNVIRAEMERIKLALLDYSSTIQSNILTKQEVEKTLSSMINYALEARGKHGVSIGFSFEQLHQISDTETDQRFNEFNIFPLLQKYLIKTILEIEILFQPLLKRDIEQDFDDFMFDCFKHYPSESEIAHLRAAILTHNTQCQIQIDAIDTLSNLHPHFAALYPENSTNTTFIDVFKATENAIFLTNNSNISQLIDDKFCKAQYREKRKAIDQEILALTNPREIQSFIEDELDHLDLFADTSITIQSIPRQLRSWLIDRLETTKQNIGNIFLPASKDPAGQVKGRNRLIPIPLSKQKTIAKAQLDFLSGYNIEGQKIMSDSDYNLLLQYVNSLLTDKVVPVITHRIWAHISQEHLRYSFYRIYKALHLKEPSRNDWISLLHAIFSTFDVTEKEVTYKKFSSKPKSYDKDMEAMEAIK